MTDLSERHLEALETLAGLRVRTNKLSRAVRLSEVQALAALPKMKSTALTSSPSADDFNTLRRDIANIHETLSRLAEVIGAAVRK